MEATVVQPEAVAPLASVSTVSSFAELGLRALKAKVTDSTEDKKMAKEAAYKNIGSFTVGKLIGIPTKQLPNPVKNAISYGTSKIYENGVKEAIKDNKDTKSSK